MFDEIIPQIGVNTREDFLFHFKVKSKDLSLLDKPDYLVEVISIPARVEYEAGGKVRFFIRDIPSNCFEIMMRLINKIRIGAKDSLEDNLKELEIYLDDKLFDTINP